MTIPTTTMHEVSKWGWTIRPVEVTRTTKQSAYVIGCNGKERRDRLVGKGYEILPTWEEAHQRLLELADKALEDARMNLERARGRRGQIAGMVKS